MKELFIHQPFAYSPIGLYFTYQYIITGSNFVTNRNKKVQEEYPILLALSTIITVIKAFTNYFKIISKSIHSLILSSQLILLP